jgi:hypothetical protein
LASRNQTLLGLCFSNDFSCYIYIYIYIYIPSAHLVWCVFVFVGEYLIDRVHTCKYVSMCIYGHSCSRSYMYWLEVGKCLSLRSCVTLYNMLLIDSQVFLDLAEKDMKQVNALFREVI